MGNWTVVSLDYTSKSRDTVNNLVVHGTVANEDATRSYRANLNWPADSSGNNRWTQGDVPWSTTYTNLQTPHTQAHRLTWIFSVTDVPPIVPPQQIVVTFEIEDGKK